jgi:hypothetical protein
MSGKTAVVTGASRGIGKQIAIELGRRGSAGPIDVPLKTVLHMVTCAEPLQYSGQFCHSAQLTQAYPKSARRRSGLRLTCGQC